MHFVVDMLLFLNANEVVHIIPSCFESFGLTVCSHKKVLLFV
jgi:hypothetical protein